MLAELSIKNFAIIKQLSLSFEEGLTVITGETGAGKSIIIDAIQLLSGGRGSAKYVRHGAKKAEIEALFFVENEHLVMPILEHSGISITEGMLVLQRDIFDTGKSVCRVNNKLVTLSVLRQLGNILIDIHGQHEHQDLLQTDKHVTLLDKYGQDVIQPILHEYERLFQEYNELKNKLKQLTENEQEMAHRLDLIQYQYSEITDAQLHPDEELRLLEERTKLDNYEKLYDAVGQAYAALSEDNKGLFWLSHAMSSLNDVSDLDKELKTAYEAIADSFYLLEDTVNNLRLKFEQLEYNPEKLAEIENRLNEIHVLKRKYGDSIEEILNYAANIKAELAMITNREHHVEKLEKKLHITEQDLFALGKKLRAVRQQVAKSLTHKIHSELSSLHMDKSTFNIHFSPLTKEVESKTEENARIFSKNGLDRIEFYISTNPGEPLKRLADIASGGEMSRIMLALKTIFSNREGKTSIIFDEVDTGVSGRVAQAMAEKIEQLSRSSQVFCITHLPQVAALSDHHLYISKEITNDHRTITNVTLLSTQEKVKEIARMISGVEMTPLTKKHAQELIKLAEEMKSTS